MQFETVFLEEKTIVALSPGQDLFGNAEPANDLLSLAWENEAAGLLIDAAALAPEFFDFQNGIAGEVLQKLVNYSVRTAIVIQDLESMDIRVRELAHDHRRHSTIRFFADETSATTWLVRSEG